MHGSELHYHLTLVGAVVALALTVVVPTSIAWFQARRATVARHLPRR